MKARVFITLLLVVSLKHHAFAVQPSEEKVDRLLELIGAAKIVDRLHLEADGILDATISSELRKRNLTQASHEMLYDLRRRLKESIRQSITWSMLGPQFRSIYINKFTAEEIDALTAFYSTPAGQSSLSKLVEANAQSKKAVEVAMVPVIREIQQQVAKALSPPTS